MLIMMFMFMMLMMMKLEQVPTFFCSDTAMLTSTVNYHAHINCELPWRQLSEAWSVTDVNAQ